jgi:hypothetical protein
LTKRRTRKTPLGKVEGSKEKQAASDFGVSSTERRQYGDVIEDRGKV